MCSSDLIRGGAVGVRVDRSVLTVLDGTVRTTAGQAHAVLATGGVTRVTVRGTTVAGRGAGALVGRTGAVVVADGVRDRWAQRPGLLLWFESHVSAVPLLVVLVVPALGLAFVTRRRRRHRELRRMLEDALVRRGREALADYRVGAPAPSATPTAEPPGELVASRSFTSVRDFAISAVAAGYPPSEVARTLRVPTSRVRAWVGADGVVLAPAPEPAAKPR